MYYSFGIISPNRDIQSCIENIPIQFKHNYKYNKDGLGYYFSLDDRNTFKEPFHISDSVKIFIGGDILFSKEFITNLIISIETSITEDYYAYSINRIKQSINKIEGIFYIIIFDISTNRVCIFSESNGLLPIYYYHNKDEFIFSSSIGFINSILKLSDLNYEAIYELFKLGYCVVPNTLFKDIKQIFPGDIIEFNKNNLIINSLYSKSPNIPEILNINDASDLYYDLLKRSIVECVGDNKKVGLSLSEGIDSSTIASILYNFNIPVKCYTFQPTEDESEINNVKELCKRFDFEHEVIKFNDEILPAINRILELNEFPIYNGVMDYYSGKILNDIEVLLTGDGNDLVWSIYSAELENYNPLDIILNSRTQCNDEILNKLFRFPTYSEILNNKIKKLYNNTGDFLRDIATLDSKLIGLSLGSPNLGRLKLIPNNYLLRFPYLDSGLRSFVINLPKEYKQLPGSNIYNFTSKYLLKYMCEQKNLLSKENIYRRKSWMQSPNASWLRNELKGDFENNILNGNNFIEELFDIDIITKLFHSHINQDQDNSHILMLLFQFDLWYKKFILN